MKRIDLLLAAVKFSTAGLILLTCGVARAQGAGVDTDKLRAEIEPAILELVELSANSAVWERKEELSPEAVRIVKERTYISSAAGIIRGGNVPLARRVLATVGDLADHIRRYRRLARSPEKINLDHLAYAFARQGADADADQLLPFVDDKDAVNYAKKSRQFSAGPEMVNCDGLSMLSMLLTPDLYEELKRSRRPLTQGWEGHRKFIAAVPCIVNEDIREGRIDDALLLLADATDADKKNSKALLEVSEENARAGSAMLLEARNRLIQTLAYISTSPLLREQERFALKAERHSQFPDLPLDLAVKTVRGSGSRAIVTFQDPNEPYSRRLAKELATMNDVTVYTFLVSIRGTDSKDKATAVWCSADRAKALGDLMLNGDLPAAPAGCVAPVELVHQLVQKLRLTSTPTIFLANGKRIQGAVPAKFLEAALDRAAAGK